RSLQNNVFQEVRDLAHDIALAFGDASSAPQLRQTLSDPHADATAREQALEQLVRLRDAETAPLLAQLLGDAGLRGAAIRALASYDDAGAARALLGRYPSLGTSEKRDALNTLSSRTSYAAALLDAVESGAIARTDVGAFVVRKLENLGDAAL